MRRTLGHVLASIAVLAVPAVVLAAGTVAEAACCCCPLCCQ
jgi:hypothetical protein